MRSLRRADAPLLPKHMCSLREAEAAEYDEWCDRRGVDNLRIGIIRQKAGRTR
jgi:hypothetical protein